MGWRGAGGNGAANIGSYYSFGGILMLLGSLGEVSGLSSVWKSKPYAF
jgi:hypothetical protein